MKLQLSACHPARPAATKLSESPTYLKCHRKSSLIMFGANFVLNIGPDALVSRIELNNLGGVHLRVFIISTYKIYGKFVLSAVSQKLRQVDSKYDRLIYFRD